MCLQTPILVSLVKKDAAMLDAFGKGASEDIQASKEVLYRNLTRNPETGEPMCAPSKISPKSLPVSPNQARHPSCCHTALAPSTNGVDPARNPCSQLETSMRTQDDQLMSCNATAECTSGATRFSDVCLLHDL